MTLALLLGIVLTVQDSGRLSLNDAVASAVRSHPAVAAARAADRRAEADVGAARAGLVPRVRLDASMTQFQEPMIVYPLHSLTFASPPVFDRTLVQPGVSAAWTLFDFGARRSQVTAASAEETAAASVVDGSMQQVVAEAAAAYVRVLAARDRIRVTGQHRAALQSELERVRNLLAAGKAAQVEVLRAQAGVQRAIAEQASSGTDLDAAEHDLASITGLPFQSVRRSRLAPLRLVDASLATDSVGNSRAALVERALANNPDSRVAERRAAAARAAASAARGAGLPQIQASGAYLSPGSINGNFHPDWQAGVMMSYALFSGGATRSAIQAADARAQEAAEDVRLTRLNTERALDRAFAALRDAHARLGALEAAEAQSREVVRIEGLARDVGQGTQTDYLLATAELLETQMTLIDARHAELLARIQLAAVTGELSADWLARNLEALP